MKTCQRRERRLTMKVGRWPQMQEVNAARSEYTSGITAVIFQLGAFLHSLTPPVNVFEFHPFRFRAAWTPIKAQWSRPVKQQEWRFNSEHFTMATWCNSLPSRQCAVTTQSKHTHTHHIKKPRQQSCHCRAVSSYALGFKLALTFSPLSELFSPSRSQTGTRWSSFCPLNQTSADDVTSDGWKGIFLTATVSLQSPKRRLSKWAWPFSLRFILKSNENNIHTQHSIPRQHSTFVHIETTFVKQNPHFLRITISSCLECLSFGNTVTQKLKEGLVVFPFSHWGWSLLPSPSQWALDIGWNRPGSGG